LISSSRRRKLRILGTDAIGTRNSFRRTILNVCERSAIAAACVSGVSGATFR
jgi:hypothetical protein